MLSVIYLQGSSLNNVKCEQDGIIAEWSQLHNCLFLSDIFLAISVIIAKTPN